MQACMMGKVKAHACTVQAHASTTWNAVMRKRNHRNFKSAANAAIAVNRLSLGAATARTSGGGGGADTHTARAAATAGGSGGSGAGRYLSIDCV
eukprot:COSAG05_NODE_949_length_6474_cov_7.735216_3_plen_94_part_00